MKLFVFTFLVLIASVARADAQSLKATAVPVVSLNGTDEKGGLKQTITVTVTNLSSYLQQTGTKNPKFVLYLNEIPFTGLSQSVPDPGHDHLQFLLDRVDSNRVQWSALLRNPVPTRHVLLTVGLENQPPFGTNVTDFRLLIYHPAALFVATAFCLVLIGLFCWAARASDVLRESGPPPPPLPSGRVPRKAYSLAPVQMAIWFFVVVSTFFLIWMITWDRDTITTNVLAIIGISAGTGLAATVVDSGKASSMQAQKDQLLPEDATLSATLASIAAVPAPLSPADVQRQTAAQERQREVRSQIADLDKQLATPAHEHFITDILSDANGINFHRFQMAVWTIVLVIVFVTSVWKDLVMPDFNATLLGLMGISSGTYVGFKFPELKN